MSEFQTMQCEHDGITMKAFVARPAGDGPFPAVMMFPGATGTGPTFEGRARELAALGYLAIGIDVYGQGADLTSPEAAGREFMALLEAPETLRTRTLAWANAIANRGDVANTRIVALGYCFGGKCVLEMARGGADVLAVIAYHGLLKTHAPARSGEVKALIAAYCAGQDPYAPLEDFDAFRQEMSDAGVNHHVTLFSNAQHSFTDPDHEGIQPGIAYDALSDRVSWAGTLALLDHILRS